MKMLKRAGAIAIAGAMALSLGSVAYAADPTITVGKINIGEADANGIVTVTVPYTAENLATGAQVTLLAELGAAEKVYASNIVYDTTAYIDQDAAGSEFTFKINKSRLVGNEKADVWLNVKVGGTGVAKAAEGSEKAYTYVAPVTTPVTNEMISGAVDSTITDAFNTTGASVVRLDVTDLVENGKLDLTKQAVKIGDDYAYYTITSAGKYKVLYVGNIDEKTAVEVVDLADTDEARRIYYGDPSGDKIADLTDMARIAADYLNQLSFGTKEDISADVSADGIADLTDMAQIAARYLNQIDAFNVEVK